MMKTMHRSWVAALMPAVALTLVAGACKRSAPQDEAGASTTAAPTAVAFQVTNVELGRGIGADKRVLSPMTSFGPRDTIYASVLTEGASQGTTLAARWSFETGQVVEEQSETIEPTGPAVTEFHVSKASGWPTGKYTVEIMVDGVAASTEEFEVR